MTRWQEVHRDTRGYEQLPHPLDNPVMDALLKCLWCLVLFVSIASATFYFTGVSS